MKLSTNELNELSQTSVTAALCAGKHIAKQFYKEFKIYEKKSAGSYASSILTQVDLESQEIIFEQLKSSIKKYNLAFVSEEKTDDKKRFEKNYFWCVDPLDGTLSFVQQKHGFTVSIALVARNGTSIVGTIYDPLKQSLYHAIKNQGAFINHKLINNNYKDSNNQTMNIFIDNSFMKENSCEAVIKKIENISSKLGFKKLVINEGKAAAINACLVLETPDSCYFKFPRKKGGGSIWDYAASACIFNEAGYTVSDITGKKLDLNRAESTYLNNKGILFSSNEEIARQVIMLYSEQALTDSAKTDPVQATNLEKKTK